MRAVRTALLASAIALLGCSGSYEYAHPPVEPDDGATSPPATTAHPDTHECLPEGAEIPSGTDASASPPCCSGLTRAEVYRGSILRLDTCEPEGDGHAFCIRCGDGRCGVGENTCSCEADCRWP
jgi:hypothetical protein